MTTLLNSCFWSFGSVVLQTKNSRRQTLGCINCLHQLYSYSVTFVFMQYTGKDEANVRFLTARKKKRLIPQVFITIGGQILASCFNFPYPVHYQNVLVPSASDNGYSWRFEWIVTKFRFQVKPEYSIRLLTKEQKIKK